MKEEGWVIYKNSRDPGRVSYTGPTWDRAGIREHYREVYDSELKAKSLAHHLTHANPGVGFSVAERPKKE